jgi:hypothetical protein
LLVAGVVGRYGTGADAAARPDGRQVCASCRNRRSLRVRGWDERLDTVAGRSTCCIDSCPSELRICGADHGRESTETGVNMNVGLARSQVATAGLLIRKWMVILVLIPQ